MRGQSQPPTDCIRKKNCCLRLYREKSERFGTVPALCAFGVLAVACAIVRAVRLEDMHELSMAQDILEIVNQYVPPEQMSAVRSVRLRLGRLSGIVADSLEFCFSAIVADTPLEQANLDIERVPTRADCPDCGKSFLIDDPVFLCPHCGGAGIRLVSGTELQVVEIELADQESEAI